MAEYRVYYSFNGELSHCDYISLENAIDFMYSIGLLTKELVMLCFTYSSKRYYFDGTKFEIKQG